MPQTEAQRAALAKANAKRREQREKAAASASADVAPKAEPAGKLPSPPSMRNQIGLLVSGVNELLLLTPWTAPEALDQVEAELLIDGLDGAQKGSPGLRKYIKLGAGGSGWFGLGMAVIGISVARLARHGYLPWLRPEQAPRRTEQQIEDQLVELARQRRAVADAIASDEAAAAQSAEPGIRLSDLNGANVVPPVYVNGSVA